MRPGAPFSRCPRCARCSRWPCSYSTISGRSISSPSPSRRRDWRPSSASRFHIPRERPCSTRRDSTRSQTLSRGSEPAVASWPISRWRSPSPRTSGRGCSLSSIWTVQGVQRLLGHPSGDQLLARLGSRPGARELRDVCVYRLGGDECLPSRAGRGSGHRAPLDEAVGKALTERGAGFEVTSSFGAVLIPEEAAQPSEALRCRRAPLRAEARQARDPGAAQHRPLLEALLSESPRSTHTPRTSPGFTRSACSSGSSRPSTS